MISYHPSIIDKVVFEKYISNYLNVQFIDDNIICQNQHFSKQASNQITFLDLVDFLERV